MKLKVFSTVAVLLVLALGACSSPTATPVPKQASIELSGDDFARTQHMTQQVEVAQGGMLNVFLASNPSTGYQWTADAAIGDKTIVEQAAHGYVAPQQTGTPVVGAAGKETWSFKTLKPGTTTVSMRYARPWESNMGLWSLTLNVKVK